ncbi:MULTISPECIES: hypothetical protein [unclassified Bradyrhizobium]|uniref:hypothetical protein n=1 Tax=unclassified Bradyrhizobium TaxID=2631580 RepID=UPI00201165DB|nr:MULTISPECIES: hypothetical protein [unclassified Bradyrhizobium]
MSAAALSGAKRHSLSSPPSDESDRLEAAADQAIAACNGDMRSAIRALILANEYLEYELCQMFTAVSKGYARGRVKAKDGSSQPIDRGATTGNLPDGDAA